MLGSDGWEVAVGNGVGYAFNCAGSFLRINSLKQSSVIHVPFGVLLIQLPFELELNDGDSLVHLGYEFAGFFVRSS